MPRLRRVNSSKPGIQRRRRGRGFEFIDTDGKRLTDRETLERIKQLVIPPAWEDVWICPSPWGHLQAVGTDSAGRKQYLYHPQWRTRRDQQKFDRMLEFAKALPGLRKRIGRDLAKKELSRDRVLACAVRLLDRGFFRMGSEGYAEANETYGIATIKKSHVRCREGLITFDYPAKGGLQRIQTIGDGAVCEIVSDLKRRSGGGDELLAYKDGRRWVDLKSADINDYIKSATAGNYSAKDFRTWNATVFAAVALAVSREARAETAQKRAMSRAVKEVASYLGNTPAVCRASYIDPRAFDRYQSGWTVKLTLEAFDDKEVGELAVQGKIEEAVIDLLDEKRSPALEMEKIA